MIHQYKLNGYNIVLDIFSGSIHIVDDYAYEAVRICDSYGREGLEDRLITHFKDDKNITEDDIKMLAEDIDELIASGKLFTEDIFEANAFDLKNRHTQIKALCLHVAHT